MSLYVIGQRVWSKSQACLGIITEANYMTVKFDDGFTKRRAIYVLDLVSSERRNGEHVRLGLDWMCGSSDLRAADWGCDGCDRWLPGSPYANAPDGEYPSGLHFCFLCAAPQVCNPDNLDYDYC